jgi:hypothetical protein
VEGTSRRGQTDPRDAADEPRQSDEVSELAIESAALGAGLALGASPIAAGAMAAELAAQTKERMDAPEEPTPERASGDR